MFRTAGNYVRDDVVFRTIQLVSAELNELHSYVVREMWRSIKETGDNASDKQPLVQVKFPLVFCSVPFRQLTGQYISLSWTSLTMGETSI